MSGRIPLAGVIGHPVGHSKSPALHGHWLARYGIAGHYVPLDVAPGDFGAALRALPKLGFVGANVTIPHKEAALAQADRATDRARLVGAANTLIFGENGEVQADNTDGHGFLQNLRQEAPNWKPENGPALVLGAGGAARAVVVALLQAGTPEVVLCNRTRAKAEALAGEMSAALGPRVRVIDWETAPAALPEAATVVNTTALGMMGQPPLTLALDGLHPGQLVTDIVYAPLETELLRAGRAAGCKVVDGLGMLLHQAAPGFEAWFGQRPEVDADLRAAVLT